MVGPLLALVAIFGVATAGWQALDARFSKADSSRNSNVSQMAMPLPQKEVPLPLGLPRHEVIYHNIRQQALSLDASFFRKFLNQEIWTILAEVKTGNTAVTLLAGIDGTVSLYRSSGENSLGHGRNHAIQQAALSLFTRAKDSLPQFVEADEIPLPKEGEYVFYLYGPKGTFTSKVPAFDLDSEHPLYDLMLATNEVLQLVEQSGDHK